MSVEEHVKWWVNDMVYKPPEMVSEKTAHGMWYLLCFAKDIMAIAQGKGTTEWVARRFDPPKEWLG